MATRKAQAEWKNGLKDGKGAMRLGSGAFEGAFSFGTRFEDEPGTNPEELIGAALAGCYSMALSAGLGQAGHAPESIRTQAAVRIEKAGDGFAITGIHLTCEARVPGIDHEAFQEAAEDTKQNCPVSKALAGTEITLDATLL